MAHKEIVINERNNRFAAAFDYLKRQGRVHTQVELAKLMGVNKDTITNILHCYTPVTEDIISKLQAATDGIFNLQWLRGVDDVMLATSPADPSPSSPEHLDASSVINTIVAAKDGQIAAMERELAAKDELIEYMRREIEQLRSQQANSQIPTGNTSYPVWPDSDEPLGVADNSE